MTAGSPFRAEPGRWASADRVLLALIVLTLPWEFSKRLFPVDWLELSRVIMAVAIAWLAVQFVRRRPRIRLEPRGVIAAMLAVIVVEVASYGITQWPTAPRDVALMAAYTLLAIFVAATIRRRADLASIAAVLIVSGIIVAALGIAEQLGNVYLWKDHPLEVLGRRNSTFADPNITARFLVLVLVTVLGAFAAWRPRRTATWIAMAVLVVGIEAALVFTLSRSGWAIGALAVVLWLPVGIARRPAGAGALLALAAFLVIVALSPNALRRASEAIDVGDPLPPTTAPLARPAVTSLDGLIARVPLDEVRRYLLRAGIAMFEDAPLAGLGVGGFQPEIIGPYRNFIPADRQTNVTSLQHIDLVRIASETGVLGLFAFLGLIVACWWGLWHSARASPWPDRVIAYALGLMLLVIILSSQSEGRFYTEPYLWLVIGGIVAFIRRGRDWVPVASTTDAPPPSGAPGATLSTGLP